MEERVFGIILTILGITGLILGGFSFMESDNVKKIVIYFILGAIFFFAGISLIRNTRDKAT